MNRHPILVLALTFLFTSFCSACVRAEEEQGPWLPQADQKKIVDLIPKGVPVGKNLKFYKLQPVYQKMYTMNNGNTRINEITPVEDVNPWRVSGGMHHVDQTEWRNVTGLDLPGKIELWQEDTDVRAFSLVPKWRWQFPEGTRAYDVLLRTKEGKEHVFEVRIHEKQKEGWDDGTTYRPKLVVGKFQKNHWEWEFSNVGLSAKATTHSGKIPRKVEFAATRQLVIDDGDFSPPNYVGAGMTCNACHSRVGEIYDVPGRIYREARRGDDGRFSWHPFDDNGQIDRRWPLVRK